MKRILLNIRIYITIVTIAVFGLLLGNVVEANFQVQDPDSKINFNFIGTYNPVQSTQFWDIQNTISRSPYSNGQYDLRVAVGVFGNADATTDIEVFFDENILVKFKKKGSGNYDGLLRINREYGLNIQNGFLKYVEYSSQSNNNKLVDPGEYVVDLIMIDSGVREIVMDSVTVCLPSFQPSITSIKPIGSVVCPGGSGVTNSNPPNTSTTTTSTTTSGGGISTPKTTATATTTTSGDTASYIDVKKAQNGIEVFFELLKVTTKKNFLGVVDSITIDAAVTYDNLPQNTVSNFGTVSMKVYNKNGALIGTVHKDGLEIVSYSQRPNVAGEKISFNGSVPGFDPDLVIEPLSIEITDDLLKLTSKRISLSGGSTTTGDGTQNSANSVTTQNNAIKTNATTDGSADNTDDSDNNQDQQGGAEEVQKKTVPRGALRNPLPFNTIPEVVNAFVKGIVIPIAVPLLGIAIMYTGFLFVYAKGKPTELEKAKEALKWTLIGGAIILASYVIAEALQATIKDIMNP